MSTEAATIDPNAGTNSPFHQPVTDNSGTPQPALDAHTQRPDTRSAPEPGSLSQPPARRSGALTNAQFHSLPPADQDRYAQLRADEWVPRADLEKQTPPSTEAGTDGGAVDKFGEMEFTEQELRDLLTNKADAELRKANLPATPADYRADLPENFQLPNGIEFKIDETDPLLADFRNFSHAKGWDQQTFSEVLGIYATAQAKEAAFINDAAKTEIAKLGANGTARVTAIDTWLRGMLGDNLAKSMRTVMATADIVKGWEIIQQKFSSQGAASFSQSHREPQGGSRITEEQWSGMSDGQRLAYAQSHDQSQFGGARR